jgi:hypothetical protein
MFWVETTGLSARDQGSEEDWKSSRDANEGWGVSKWRGADERK